MRPPCSFPDCGRPNAAHRLCAGHLAQKKRGAPLGPLQPRMSRTGQCSHVACDWPIEARGLCSSHYRKRRKT